VIAFASSLDQVGPITKDVRDAATVLGVIAGHDPHEATSVNRPVPDYVAALNGQPPGLTLPGLRIGVPREYFIAGMQPGVESAVRAAIRLLESLGATTHEITLPHTDYSLPTYYLLAPAEASANLARYDGVKYGYRSGLDSAQPSDEMWDVTPALAWGASVRATRGEGFGAEVKRRIMLGTYALSAGYYDAYYLKAQKVRTLIKQDFDQAFDAERVDVIVGPTSPSVAFKIGEKVDDPLQMYLADVFTLAQALAGIPAISIPCGFAETLSGAAGLPVGLQIMARAFDEERMLQVAYAYEQATEWHKRKPVISQQ
jgi:aspartyl-tRNA(Asn)/glutamyl-tRNA(Gln) amidotransferase subunit A